MAAPLVAPSAERWAAIEPLFDHVLELPPQQRSGWLADACSEDPALQQEIERLLRASEATDGFFREPAQACAWPLGAGVPAPAPFAAGEWLGHYLIEGELGRGGMATVYLAHDPRHGRRVALKVLRPELSGLLGPGRFAREVAIAARLSHPHILPLYDSGTIEGEDNPPLLYYSMPFVAGRSLRDRLRETPQLAVAEALEITRQVAAALDYAHRQGVIHRDIKPENILIAEGGARVADFGIARALDAAGGERLTETGMALGTPAYMSPEQASASGKVDGRADLYALGCVLYEMLAGEPPFTGSTPQAVLARHAMDAVPSMLTVRPTLSPELARVVRRALAKVPADRYPTAAAFRAVLAAPELTRVHEVQVQPVARVGPRGRRVVLAGGALLVAGVATALALAARARAVASLPTDPGVVAIAPFRVASADPTLGYLREGLVDLLVAKLSGTLAVRPVDSRTLLNAWRRTGSDQTVDEREALAVSRRLGAGQLVMGDVGVSGSRVTLSAELLPVAAERKSVRLSVEGPSDSIQSLIDQLAARLLARLAGEPEERLPALASTSKAALRAYLDGWTLLRHYALDGARRKFESALATDSTLAVAALGALRAMFERSPPFRSEPNAQLAWRLRDRLGPKDRAYLEVIVGPRYPDASTMADERAATERLTRLDPESADAWNLYAVFHCDLRPARPDSALDARCRAMSRRIVTLDTTNALPLFNAAGWAADQGDTALARHALRLYLKLDPLSPTGVMTQWLMATKLGDTATAHRAVLSDSMVSTDPGWNIGVVWALVGHYLSTGRGLSDAELVIRRSQAIAATGAQRSILEGIPIRIAVMRGRADGLPAWFSGEMEPFERVSDALFADRDPAFAAQAMVALERQIGRPITGGCCLLRFMAAQSALAKGKVALGRRAVVDIERYVRAQNDSVVKGSELPIWPLILEAQLTVRAHDAAAPELLRRLDSALVNQDPLWGYAPLYGNLIAARLHESRGEYQAALAALRRRDRSLFWPIVVTYYRDEGRIAAEAGDTAGAIRAYERYLRIRDDVEPRLRPEVERVRAELAALRPHR